MYHFSRSLTPFTSYSGSELWFLWGRQTLPEASLYKSVYSSKWIREVRELFKLSSSPLLLKCIKSIPTYWCCFLCSLLHIHSFLSFSWWTTALICSVIHRKAWHRNNKQLALLSSCHLLHQTGCWSEDLTNTDSRIDHMTGKWWFILLTRLCVCT